MLTAAFVGWQVVSVHSKKAPSFAKYASDFGLMDKPSDRSRDEVERDRMRSRTNTQIALEAFRKGVERA